MTNADAPWRCSVVSCKKVTHQARGFCRLHYTRWRRGKPLEDAPQKAMPDESLMSRLLKKTTVVNGKCWEWFGPQDKRGYGNVKLKGVVLSTHRAMWSEVNGEIPQGMFVCHQCDNPSCLNPEHLFLGSARDNIMDMCVKGRSNVRDSLGRYVRSSL